VRKIPTLFVRSFTDARRVAAEVNEEARWVINGEGIATRKYDGTCVMFDGAWWARREVKPGKPWPANYLPISLDPNTGKQMGWEPIEQSAFARFHAEALESMAPLVMSGSWMHGTYELIGPKINGNPEETRGHALISHAGAEILRDVPRSFIGLREYMNVFHGEGIVWHHPDGRMAKIKRRDFWS
jgi:hypothetical protein